MGKTVIVEESSSAIPLGENFWKNTVYTEHHRYEGAEVTQWKLMETSGMGQAYVRWMHSYAHSPGSGLYMNSTGLVGVAETSNMLYKRAAGWVPVFPLVNTQVDRAIP